MTARCSTCGAAIIWARTPDGKAMPVDAEPHDDGNVILTPRGDRPPIAHVIFPGDRLPGRRLSHFVTCPDASAWRRRTPKEAR